MRQIGVSGPELQFLVNRRSHFLIRHPLNYILSDRMLVRLGGQTYFPV
jgi:hypothetical protein